MMQQIVYSSVQKEYILISTIFFLNFIMCQSYFVEPVTAADSSSNMTQETTTVTGKKNKKDKFNVTERGDEMEVDGGEVKKSKRKTLKDIRKAASSAAAAAAAGGGGDEDSAALRATTAAATLLAEEKLKQFELEISGEAEWGGIKLNILLQRALLSLNFNLPTPIQTAAIPLLASGKCDLVGAAETGSGSFVRSFFSLFVL